MYYLEYFLVKGFIHNWLVAGPHATPVTDLERYQGSDLKLQIAKACYKRLSEVHEPPIENGTVQVGDTEAAKQSVPEYRDPWKFPAEYLQT